MFKCTSKQWWQKQKSHIKQHVWLAWSISQIWRTSQAFKFFYLVKFTLKKNYWEEKSESAKKKTSICLKSTLNGRRRNYITQISCFLMHFKISFNIIFQAELTNWGSNTLDNTSTYVTHRDDTEIVNAGATYSLRSVCDLSEKKECT